MEEAGQVFLLMKKDYRISRNVRLAWFLNHLHQTVQATPQEFLVRSSDRWEVRAWPRRTSLLGLRLEGAVALPAKCFLQGNLFILFLASEALEVSLVY